MNTEPIVSDPKETTKRLIIAILIIISLKNLFDVFVGGGLSIIQVIVDAFLVVILLIRPFQFARKLVIARAILALLFWVIFSLFSSGVTLALIVFFEELFVGIPLLMLSLGYPGTLRKYLAMVLFLFLGIGSYIVMILLVL